MSQWGGHCPEGDSSFSFHSHCHLSCPLPMHCPPLTLQGHFTPRSHKFSPLHLSLRHLASAHKVIFRNKLGLVHAVLQPLLRAPNPPSQTGWPVFCPASAAAAVLYTCRAIRLSIPHPDFLWLMTPLLRSDQTAPTKWLYLQHQISGFPLPCLCPVSPLSSSLSSVLDSCHHLSWSS